MKIILFLACWVLNRSSAHVHTRLVSPGSLSSRHPPLLSSFQPAHVRRARGKEPVDGDTHHPLVLCHHLLRPSLPPVVRQLAHIFPLRLDSSPLVWFHSCLRLLLLPLLLRRPSTRPFYKATPIRARAHGRDEAPLLQRRGHEVVEYARVTPPSLHRGAEPARRPGPGSESWRPHPPRHQYLHRGHG